MDVIKIYIVSLSENIVIDVSKYNEFFINERHLRTGSIVYFINRLVVPSFTEVSFIHTKCVTRKIDDSIFGKGK